MKTVKAEQLWLFSSKLKYESKKSRAKNFKAGNLRFILQLQSTLKDFKNAINSILEFFKLKQIEKYYGKIKSFAVRMCRILKIHWQPFLRQVAQMNPSISFDASRCITAPYARVRARAVRAHFAGV